MAPTKTFLAPIVSHSFPYSGSTAAEASANELISHGILSIPWTGSRSRTIGTVAADTMLVSSTASRIVTRQTAKPIRRCAADIAGALASARPSAFPAVEAVSGMAVLKVLDMVDSPSRARSAGAAVPVAGRSPAVAPPWTLIMY